MRRTGGGFRLPAEWERHAATWIAWPHNREERVRILVENRAMEEQARRVLGKVGAQMETVEFFACPTNRSWTPDFGPIFVKNRRGEMLAPTFNDPHDRAAPAALARVFPDREVVGFNCTDLIWGLGALHCMTQQEPG